MFRLNFNNLMVETFQNKLFDINCGFKFIDRQFNDDDSFYKISFDDLIDYRVFKTILATETSGIDLTTHRPSISSLKLRAEHSGEYFDIPVCFAVKDPKREEYDLIIQINKDDIPIINYRVR